jgi:hypothetical protein
MKELCIDISEFQRGIDYNDIKNNCKYVVLRAGWDVNEDNRFQEHYNNLQGIHLGCYWYSYATNCDEARAEARKCLEVIKGKKFELPIYLDIEDSSISGLGRENLNNIIRTFGYEIQKAGYYFGVYTNLNWYCNIISGNELNKEFDWWIALWGGDAPDPSYNINYGIWQFGSTWIGGQNVDGDYIYKDYPKIIRELGLNHLDDEPTPPTPPQPTPKIEEDGLWGCATTRLAQQTFKSGLVDGIVSNQLIWWKDENPGLLGSTFEWQDSMNGGSALIVAIQKWCGANPDGYIGRETITKMQQKLNCEVIDGCVSFPSAMVKAFQHWLNEQ